jgi:hypothetical protein
MMPRRATRAGMNPLNRAGGDKPLPYRDAAGGDVGFVGAGFIPARMRAGFTPAYPEAE